MYRSLTNTHSLWFIPQHSLQELERLTAETAQMEKEKRTLETVLSDSRVERDSIRYPNTLSCNIQSSMHQRG